MKHLITYIFISFIGLNFLISIYGWWQSNHENIIPYNRQTEIIDTIWDTSESKEDKIIQEHKNIFSYTPNVINRSQSFINQIIKAKPAFQHLYLEIHGNLQRLLGKSYMIDSNKNNDIVRLSNGQLNFTSKINRIYTSDNNINDLYIAIKELKKFKEYILQNSPKSKLYFIFRPQKGSGHVVTYNLNHPKNYNYTKKQFIKDIKSLNFSILNLNEMVSTNHYNVFYNTDHHWRVEYAFNQIPTICHFLNLNDSIYSKSNFKLINTNKIFSGSLTKRTGNGFTLLTDTFKYYIPHIKTSFTADYYSKNKIIRRKGTLDQTLLFLEKLQDPHWNANLYSICNQGDNPLVRITNHHNTTEKNILILGDSFSAPIISYLSLSFKHMDCIDLRSCNTSILMDLIKQNQYEKICLIYPDVYDEKMYTFIN